MSKKRSASGQRNLSRARATRRPASAVAAPAPKSTTRRGLALSPRVTRWLRTSKVPIILAAIVLVAILVAMFFRLTEGTPAASLSPAAHVLGRWLVGGSQWAAGDLTLGM